MHVLKRFIMSLKIDILKRFLKILSLKTGIIKIIYSYNIYKYIKELLSWLAPPIAKEPSLHYYFQGA